MRTAPTCIFCKIVAGDVPCHRVAENEGALAFLDAQPLVEGHVLVVPKAHAAHVAELDDRAASAVFRLVRDVTRAQRAGLAADAVTIGINDGRAAGQVVPHVHVHLVPRYEGDGGTNVHAIVRGEVRRSPEEIVAALAAAGTSGDPGASA